MTRRRGEAEQRASRLKVALDHNFPRPIIEAVASSIPRAELRSLSQIDPRLTDADDHVVVRAVRRAGYDLLVSCDGDYHRDPLVVSHVLQAKMTVVVVEERGHDPVTASGLLLAYLDGLFAKYAPDEAQIIRLRVGRPTVDDPWKVLDDIASRDGKKAKDLFAKHRLPDDAFAADPFER